MNGLSGREITGEHGRLFIALAMLTLLLVLSVAGRASGADWAANYGATSGATVYTQATAVDDSGNVYLAGYFNGSTFTLGSVTLTRIGTQDAFVAKLDASGTVLWAKTFGGSGATASGQSLAVDNSGNVYLGGYFQSANLTTPALTKIGTYDAFAIKLDSTGATTWAKNFGGSGASAYGQSIAVDGTGNVYLGGYIQSANLTTPTLTKIGTTDAFAIKLDSTGAITWAKNFGGNGATVRGYGIAVDGTGNVYLGGEFMSENLTAPALTKKGAIDAFAIKLDSTGAITWAKNFGGNGFGGGRANGRSIAVDSFMNVYLGGSFDDCISLTTPVLTKIGNTDAFAIKLDSSGTITWAKNFGGSSGATVNVKSIAADGTGNVYLGGYFNGASLTTPALTKIGSDDAFAIKISSTGITAWARNFGGSVAYANCLSIAVDNIGNVYLGGTFQNANLTTPALTRIGYIDALALKLNPTGATVWAKNFASIAGATSYTYPTAVDAYGNVYLAGHFDGQKFTLGGVSLTKIGSKDAFIAKLDASGTVLWAKNFGGSGASAYSQSIAVDDSGNVYLGGYFQTANLTTPALTKIGTYDAFAIKLDSSGAVTWAKNFGGSGASAFGYGIAVDNAGNVYLGGHFSGASLTTPALTKIGSDDALVIKLDSTGATTWAKNHGGGGAYAIGQSIAVDNTGNVYLGGYFFNMHLSTLALIKIGSIDAFALKLDSTGATTWAKNFGGIGASAYCNGIAVDGSGTVNLGGNFDTANLTTPALTKIGSSDVFALKLDSFGTTTWAKNFGGSGASAYVSGIAVDNSGNAYLGGNFYTANLTTPALTKIGTKDAFALKLNSTGASTWAKNFGGSGATAYGMGIKPDNSGNIYLGGYYSGANLTTPVLTKIGTQDAFIVVTTTYNLTYTAGANGSLSGATTQTVSNGNSASSVTAVPDPNYHFVNWTGTNGFVTTTNNPLTVTNVTSSMTITANFAINQYTISATATGDGTGSISSNTGGISYSYQADNSGTTSAINAGTTVTLTADAGAGSTVSWTTCDGTASGNATATATCSYSSLDGNKSTQATFTLSNATLNVTITGAGSGTITSNPQGTDPAGIACTSGTCSTTFPISTPVELLKTTDSASFLEKWEGDCTGSGSCLLTMDGNKNVTVTFSLAPKVKNITTGQPYATFADALTEAQTSAEIDLLETVISESIILGKSLILKGGWYNSFQTQGDLFTVLNGDLTIQGGDSFVEKLAIHGNLAVQGGSLLVNGVEVQ